MLAGGATVATRDADATPPCRRSLTGRSRPPAETPARYRAPVPVPTITVGAMTWLFRPWLIEVSPSTVWIRAYEQLLVADCGRWRHLRSSGRQSLVCAGCQ